MAAYPATLSAFARARIVVGDCSSNCMTSETGEDALSESMRCTKIIGIDGLDEKQRGEAASAISFCTQLMHQAPDRTFSGCSRRRIDSRLHLLHSGPPNRLP